MYEKSGTAGMKFNSILSGLETRYAGTAKNRRRLNPSSQSIFMVLRIANLKAFCMNLSLAKRIAVIESRARIPPVYTIIFPYPSYPKREARFPENAHSTRKKAILKAVIVESAVPKGFAGSVSLLANLKHPVSSPAKDEHHLQHCNVGHYL